MGRWAPAHAGVRHGGRSIPGRAHRLARAARPPRRRHRGRQPRGSREPGGDPPARDAAADGRSAAPAGSHPGGRRRARRRGARGCARHRGRRRPDAGARSAGRDDVRRHRRQGLARELPGRGARAGGRSGKPVPLERGALPRRALERRAAPPARRPGPRRHRRVPVHHRCARRELRGAHLPVARRLRGLPARGGGAEAQAHGLRDDRPLARLRAGGRHPGVDASGGRRARLAGRWAARVSAT